MDTRSRNAAKGQVNSRKTEKTAGLSAHPEEAVSLSNRRLEGPRTGITPLTGLRIPAELNAKLDAWIERQPDPKALLSVVEGPSRSEAIRRLLESALEKG